MRSPGRPSVARARGARLGTLSAVLACGLLLAMVQPAAAAKPLERSHEHIVETFPGDVCDIPVIVSVDIIENILVRLAKSGFPLFQTTGPGTVTLTNPETGKSITVRFTGNVKDLTVVDNGDGTITVRCGDRHPRGDQVAGWHRCHQGHRAGGVRDRARLQRHPH
jgi:hypothetical protein